MLPAPRSEPTAAAQGDAGTPGFGEQRGRRGEGRCQATGERRGWGMGRGERLCSLVSGEGGPVAERREQKTLLFVIGEGSLVLLGDWRRPCYLETGERISLLLRNQRRGLLPSWGGGRLLLWNQRRTPLPRDRGGGLLGDHHPFHLGMWQG